MAGEQFPKHIYSVTFFESWNNKRQCLTGKRSAKHMQLMPNVSAAEQALFFLRILCYHLWPVTNLYKLSPVSNCCPIIFGVSDVLRKENVFPFSGTSAFMAQAMAHLMGQLNVWH